MKINKTDKIMKVYNSGMNKKVKQKKNKIGKDELKFSDKAKDFKTAMNKLKDIPEVRKDKVEKLKREIKSGTYNVKGKDIAEKMYESVNFDKKV